MFIAGDSTGKYISKMYFSFLLLGKYLEVITISAVKILHSVL